jgi:Trypsin
MGHATRVLLNPYDLSQPIHKSEAFDIVQEFVHPWYQHASENSYDFMIVKINGTSILPPVRLNTDSNSPMATEQLTVMGWGYKTINAMRIANILQCANVSYITNTECEQMSLKGTYFLGSFKGKITEE